MASAVVRAYNGGLGAETPAWVWRQSPWSGGKPPDAEALLVFERSMEAANLPTFLQFANAKKSGICVIFAKNHEWPWNWGA